jgi:hypothetical protein
MSRVWSVGTRRFAALKRATTATSFCGAPFRVVLFALSLSLSVFNARLSHRSAAGRGLRAARAESNVFGANDYIRQMELILRFAEPKTASAFCVGSRPHGGAVAESSLPWVCRIDVAAEHRKVFATFEANGRHADITQTVLSVACARRSEN